MKRVAYIVKNQKGKFKLFMAQACPSPGDNDSTLFVDLIGPKFDELENAQGALNTDRASLEAQGVTIYLNPINSSPDGVSWLSELESANKENDKSPA